MQPQGRPFISILAVAAALSLWWAVGYWRLIDPLLLPAPEDVALTGYDLVVDGYRSVSLFGLLATSVARALVAFALAVLTGIPLGIAMGMSPTLNAIFDPFVQFLRPLPKLALIPLVVVWFGIGEFSKILLIYLATFLTIVVAATAAVMSVSQGRLRAARSLGVNQWQLFRHVILPSAIPELFTGVRVGIGIGWTTLIAAEMIASSSGLGWMVMNASAYLRTDVVLLGVLMLGVTGYLLDFVLVTAQRRWVHWMGKT